MLFSFAHQKTQCKHLYLQKYNVHSPKTKQSSVHPTKWKLAKWRRNAFFQNSWSIISLFWRQSIDIRRLPSCQNNSFWGLQYLGVLTFQLIIHVLLLNDVIPSCETFAMNRVHQYFGTVVKEKRLKIEAELLIRISWQSIFKFLLSDLDFLTPARLNDPSPLPIMWRSKESSAFKISPPRNRSGHKS